MSSRKHSWRSTICVILLTSVSLPCPADEKKVVEQRPDAADSPILDDWFDRMLKRLDGIDDYSCTVVTRERIGQELGQHQFLYLKYQNDPKSFYFCCLGPTRNRGSAVLFCQGKNDERMFVHSGWGCSVRPVSLPIDSPLIKLGLRTPYHKLNMRDLLDTTMAFLQDRKASESANIRWFRNAKINGRRCTVARIEHDDTEGRFQLRIFLDDQLSLPTRFALFRSDAVDGDYELIEAYTFVDVKINNNLTDADFDYRNPDYRFVRVNKESESKLDLQSTDTDSGDDLSSRCAVTHRGRCWKTRLRRR